MKCIYEQTHNTSIPDLEIPIHPSICCGKEATSFFLTDEDMLIVSFRMKEIGFVAVCNKHKPLLSIDMASDEVTEEEFKALLLLKS